MESKQYIAFDPGKTGHGIMIVDGKITKFKFPMIGTEYDLQGMLDIFDNFDRKNCHIVIEDVKALQSPMQSGNWSLSRGKTILEVAAACYGLPYTLVHSKTWQKEIWQGVPMMKKNGKTDTKNMTLVAVKRLFPDLDLRDEVETKYYADTSVNRKKGVANKPIPRKGTLPHEGVVDALAMAEYCKRKF